MNDHEPVIVGALRTPVGKRGGRLHKWHPVDLMAETLRQLVERRRAALAHLDAQLASMPAERAHEEALP